MNKNELRKKYIDVRKNISDKEEKSNIIFECVIKEEEFKKAKVVALYKNLSNEVGTSNLIDYCFKCNKNVCLPRCLGDEMDFYYIDKEEKFNKSSFNIEEPINNNIVDKRDIDLFIVPGICFDRNKNRIGFGKGYYDKYLVRSNGYKIGICFSKQVINNINSSDNDIVMDKVITEEFIIE